MMNIRVCSVLIVFAIVFTALPGRAQNTFPASGRAGIYTTAPTTSLQVNGGARFGLPANYVNIDSATGNLSFTGNAVYQVGSNKYAFQYSGNPNYGLFFNSSSIQYEFRNGSAAPIFAVNANSGNSVFSGTLKIGAYTLPATDGTSGQVLTTNGTGTVKWATVSGGGSSQWTTNGSNIYYNTGNVGIGTTTPDGALNVVGANSVSLTSAGYLQLGATSGTNIAMDNSQVQARSNGASSALNLNPYGGITNIGNAQSSSTGVQAQGSDYGVYGTGAQGVYGTGSSYGIHGNATNGTGVYGTGTTTGGYFSCSGTNSSTYGVVGSGFTGVYGTGTNYGINGYSGNGTAVNGNGAVGGSFSGSGYDGITVSCSYVSGTGVYGTTNGANATAVAGWANGNGLTYGVAGYVNDGTGEGVYGFSGSSVAYGMIAFSRNTIALYGSTNNGGSYAGYFNGNVYSSGVYTGSDQKLKENIQDVSGAIGIINQLHPRIYNFKQDGNYRYMHLPQGQHYGLIAQEVEKILPGLVKDTRFDVTREKQMTTQSLPDPKTGVVQPQAAAAKEAKEEISYKAMNYTELIPIMIKAMQEQQKQIDDLTAQVQRLTSNQPIASATDQNNATVTNITLSSAGIDQNVPNPLTNTTNIHYYVPAGNAVLMISDAAGKMIKQVSLATGAGNIAVDASTLGAGAYSYTLIIDGKTIATRKMIVAR